MAWSGMLTQSGRFRASYTTSYIALSSSKAVSSAEWARGSTPETAAYPSRKARWVAVTHGLADPGLSCSHDPPQ